MQLSSLDWIVIAVCLSAAFAPAVFFARRAGQGTTELFASGRAAPWWLIGTSMVATTFSTDTPNLVTDFVRTKGVSQNWAWWAFLLTGMMTVFFYARMWRRSGVLTDLDFYELRYSGRSAAFVRGFRAVYLGLFFNCTIMASVTRARCRPMCRRCRPTSTGAAPTWSTTSTGGSCDPTPRSVTWSGRREGSPRRSWLSPA